MSEDIWRRYRRQSRDIAKIYFRIAEVWYELSGGIESLVERASGGTVCESCELMYAEHPCVGNGIIVLCSGELVHL